MGASSSRPRRTAHACTTPGPGPRRVARGRSRRHAVRLQRRRRRRPATGTTTGKRDATASGTDINPVPGTSCPTGGPCGGRSWHSRRTSTPGNSTAPRPTPPTWSGRCCPRCSASTPRRGPRSNKDYLDSAELTAKDPRQVVTYRINPRAVWDDGTPISGSRLRSAVEGAVGIQPGVPDRLVERLRPDRERRPGRRRP